MDLMNISEQTIDNYLSHSKEIEKDNIILTTKLYTKDKYIKKTLSDLAIEIRYNDLTSNLDAVFDFIQHTRKLRNGSLKHLKEVGDKKYIFKTHFLLDREVYRNRKFMNVQNGKFKADIIDMFQDYIGEL